VVILLRSRACGGGGTNESFAAWGSNGGVGIEEDLSPQCEGMKRNRGNMVGIVEKGEEKSRTGEKSSGRDRRDNFATSSHDSQVSLSFRHPTKARMEVYKT
jgi:hypothetical protein